VVLSRDDTSPWGDELLDNTPKWIPRDDRRRLFKVFIWFSTSWLCEHGGFGALPNIKTTKTPDSQKQLRTAIWNSLLPPSSREFLDFVKTTTGSSNFTLIIRHFPCMIVFLRSVFYFIFFNKTKVVHVFLLKSNSKSSKEWILKH